MKLLRLLRNWLQRRATPRPLGLRGEAWAARYLRRRGYKIVSRGERLGNFGEIDLVAVHDRTVCFVEVKTRRSLREGHPAEAVNDRKRRRLTRVALAYLKRHGLLEYPARFDIVAVTWPKNQRRPRIQHYPNAFEPVGVGSLFG